MKDFEIQERVGRDVLKDLPQNVYGASEQHRVKLR
jgi:hypothetical protein